jgi:glutamate--cysteine ligase
MSNVVDPEVVAENRRRIVAYFEGGARPAGANALGVEVEHFAVHGDGRAVPYEGDGREPGVRQVLEALAAAYPERAYGEHGDLLGLAAPDGSVTLEPAAQIEISVAPYADVASVERAYRRFRDAVDPELARFGARLAAFGYHPKERAADLPLIPKERYRIMDEHFARIGTRGIRMMRASASTQVSVDYTSEADAVRKLRVASALAPVLAAVADNTPVLEGAPVGAPISHLALWRDVDPRRCGQVPGVFEEGFGFGAYADWLLDVPPLFVPAPELRETSAAPAAEVWAEPMSTADIEHLLSMVWPDVRLKRFVEIRPADSLPEPQILGYTALVKGIFYSEASLAAVEKTLGVREGRWPLDERATDRAIEAIRAEGRLAPVHGTALGEWVDLLFGLAADALPRDELHYLDDLRAFWNRG